MAHDSRLEKLVVSGVNPNPVLQTIPFVAGAIFTVAFAVIQEKNLPEQYYNYWSVGAIICILSFAVYYSISHKYFVNPNRLILDILEAARSGLGPTNYRLNIMELEDPTDPQSTTFVITHCTSNMEPPESYDRKFQVKTPGVGSAFSLEIPQIIREDQIKSDLDDFPKIIWSIPVRHPKKNVVAVLNIDTDLTGLTSGEEQRVEEIGQRIAQLLFEPARI